jgi:protein-S-isoprenylcysteine O-methyltransferase Ste14
LAIASTGVAFSAAGIVQFHRSRTTVNPKKPETASVLVSSGVFKITRNPMYVGLALVLVGWAAFLSSPWTLVGPLAFGAYINRFQITPEERALSVLFGGEYSAYKATVRRWL